ncbi:MAG: DUF4293 domain-containing protein [Bacteroidetes bacterium]|nr:DUF4293 domain-containing protein [Bacteroidota bacterium]
MIQRIQSIYLLLAAVAVVVFNFVALGIDETPEPDVVVFGKNMLALFIPSLVIAGISFITIFLFSNRKLQMSITRINLFLVLVLIGLTIYFLFVDQANAVESPGMGLILPIFTFLFSFIALKKIGADEKLVRSIDRLR